MSKVKVYNIADLGVIDAQTEKLVDEVVLKKDFDKLAAPLKAWVEWEREQIKKEGPYVGKKINELIKNAESVLAEMGIEG